MDNQRVDLDRAVDQLDWARDDGAPPPAGGAGAPGGRTAATSRAGVAGGSAAGLSGMADQSGTAGLRDNAGGDRAAGTGAGSTTHRAGASTADLIRTATEQVSHLVRQEIRLATVELSQKGKRAGIGAGLFGAAGLMAFFGGAALVVMVGFLFSYVMPAWLAALVTAVLLFAIAGVAALLGRGQVRRAGKLIPEQAVESATADVQSVVHAARGGEH